MMEIIDERTKIAETKLYQKIYLGKNFIKHMEAHPDVTLEHIKEALSNINYPIGNFYIGTVNLGRTIGKHLCVNITKENKNRVQMLYRKGRSGRTPIILDGEGNDTPFITLGIAKDNEGKLRLFTAWYGTKATREPWDKNIESEQERKECEIFWSTHALVSDFDSIDWERSREAC